NRISPATRRAATSVALRVYSPPAPCPLPSEAVMPRLLPAVLLAGVVLLIPLHAQPKPKPEAKPPTATPAEQLKVAKGFKVELLYSVPKDKDGSWVCMATL